MVYSVVWIMRGFFQKFFLRTNLNFFFSLPTLLYCVLFYGNPIEETYPRRKQNKLVRESGGIFLAHVLTDLLLTRVMDSQGEKRNSTSLGAPFPV